MLAVIPPTVPVKVGEASGAKAVERNAFEPRTPVTEFRFAIVEVRPVKLVAVAALPVVLPELPVTLPAIGLVTVSPVKVPTLVIFV